MSRRIKGEEVHSDWDGKSNRMHLASHTGMVEVLETSFD